MLEQLFAENFLIGNFQFVDKHGESLGLYSFDKKVERAKSWSCEIIDEIIDVSLDGDFFSELGIFISYDAYKGYWRRVKMLIENYDLSSLI